MWKEFYLASAAAAALLYVPGYAFFRGIRFSRIMALCCAPLFGACFYSLLPVAYYEIGIPCNLISVLGPTLAIALVALIFGRPWEEQEFPGIAPHETAVSLFGKSVSIDLVAPFLYVAIGAALTYVIFIRHLSTPDAFVSRYDNQTHLNAVRAFLDSGKWSCLHENAYLAAPDNAIPIASNKGGFYPTGWHVLACIVCEAMGVSVTTGINATLVAICALLVPLGAFSFFRALFPERPSVVLLGAIASFSFPNWPWNCFVTGPLYPNLFGLGLMLPTMAFVIVSFEEHHFAENFGAFVIASLVALGALVFAHPNTVFSLYIFMAFYGASVIGRAIRKSERLGNIVRWLLYPIALAAYLAAVTAAWIGFYHIPIIAHVIGFVPSTLADTIAWGDPVNAAISALKSKTEYFVVCIACIIGCIPLARSEEKWPAIVGPTAFFVVAYACVKMGLEQASFWTAAPWYSDSRRLALNVAVFGTPLVAVLLDMLLAIPRHFLGATKASETTGGHMAAAAATKVSTPASVFCSLLILAGICAAIGYFGFGDIMTKFSHRYSTGDHIYNSWESEFVDEATKITGDALVLNMPNDGSLWAYGVNGMNTYYRSVKLKEQTEDAVLIREHLVDYATNKDVQRVVKETGAQYVMLLDKDVPYEDGMWLQQYTEKNQVKWDGLNTIDDDTPGFELVLSKDDDMRLYRIVDVSELKPAA